MLYPSSSGNLASSAADFFGRGTAARGRNEWTSRRANRNGGETSSKERLESVRVPYEKQQ